MMVKKEYVITSVISGIVGAGLMLFAIGGAPPSGIEGWMPINDRIASAMLEEAEQTELSRSSDPDSSTALALSATGMNPKSQAMAIEDSKATNEAAKSEHEDGLISINSADVKELQQIPGIGEKKAQAIVDYRNQRGLFQSVNDLTKVKGIGDKMLEKMKPHIKL